MRCRGVRIYAVFGLSGITLFALLASTTPAPAQKQPAVAEVTTPPEPSPPEPEPTPPPLDPDPWANTVATRSPFQVRLAPPIIGKLPRTDLKIDPSPGVAAITSIDVLAVTADGRSAVTAGEHGSVRLWPTLDGKREPLVIHMRAPHMLAVVRDDDAFAIAGVDAAGQLELVRATSHAEVTQRFAIELARPIVAIHASAHGFVVLRDDRVATLIDVDGAQRAELETEPGNYVVSLAVHEDGALAIIERDERTFGRWIDLATGTWGAETAALPIRGDRVVLSPSHELVAGVRGKKRDQVAIVALANGAIVDTMTDLGEDFRLVGFLDETKVVLESASDNRAWWSGNQPPAEGRAFATANGLLFGELQSAITVTSPGEYPAYVGYRMGSPVQMRAAGDGFIATDGRSLARLDARFRTRAGYNMNEGQEHINGLWLVDGRHALGFSYSADRSIYLLSTNLENATLVASQVNFWEYEPSTHLLRYTDMNGATYLARFDARTRAFGTAVQIEAKGEVVLLDAADGKGDIAIMDPAPNASFNATSGTVGANGFVKTSERTFTPSDVWWELNDHPRTLVRAPSIRARHGTLVAEIRDNRISLRDGKATRWVVPSRGASQLLWTPRGELVAFGSGMATLDLATGALRERQCGMWFGTWDAPLEGFGASSMCEEP